MTISTIFLALTIFFSAFNPAFSSFFSGENSQKLTVSSSPHQDNFPLISTSIESPTNCPVSDSISPRFSFLSRSRSNSALGGRDRSGSSGTCYLRSLVSEDKYDEIFTYNPVEPLASHGRSPLAVLFEGGKFELAAEMMVKNIFGENQESDEVMASKFIFLAANSKNPVSIESVANALKVSGVSIEAAIKKSFKSPECLLNSLLEIENQKLAYVMVDAALKHFAIEADADFLALLHSYALKSL